MIVGDWRARAAELRAEVQVLALLVRDPRVPWYAKGLAFVLVAYVVSPIDLVPDVIPVLGYVDDVLFVILVLALLRRLVPADVVADCRGRARMGESAMWRGWRFAGAMVVIGAWMALVTLLVWAIRRGV